MIILDQYFKKHVNQNLIVLISNTIIKFEAKKEIDDDLSNCVVKLLPELSTLSSVVAISIAKVEILIFEIATWTHIGHLIKKSRGFKGEKLLR